MLTRNKKLNFEKERDRERQRQRDRNRDREREYADIRKREKAGREWRTETEKHRGYRRQRRQERLWPEDMTPFCTNLVKVTVPLTKLYNEACSLFLLLLFWGSVCVCACVCVRVCVSVFLFLVLCLTFYVVLAFT